jgi:hypothetical protein
MAVTLPVRAPVTMPRRGRARVPTAQDVPFVGTPTDPGLDTSETQFGGLEARALQSFQESADAGAVALDRMVSRQEAVDAARKSSEYQQKLDEEWTRVTTEEDLSDPTVVERFGNFMRSQRDEILGGYNARPNPKASLEIDLMDLQDRYTSRASVESVEAGIVAIDRSIGDKFKPLADEAYKNPSRLPDLYQRLNLALDRYAPALTPAQEEFYRNSYRDHLANSAVEGRLSVADVDGAQSMLDKFGEAMTPDSRLAAQRRVENMRFAKDQALLEASLRSSGPEDLVVVADPTSPTGQRFVPKSQAAGLPAPGAEGGAKLSDVSTFRGQYIRESGGFAEVKRAYNSIQTALKSPSPAGDLSVIFNYMKMLDPTSVVRESEAAAVAATGSFGERLKAAGERLLGGERLTPAMRADFASQAHGAFTASREQQEQLQTQWKEMAVGSGLDPDLAVPDYIGDSRDWKPVGAGKSAAQQRPVGERISSEIQGVLQEFGVDVDLTGVKSVKDAVSKLTPEQFEKLPAPVADLMRAVGDGSREAVDKAVGAMSDEQLKALPPAVLDEMDKLLSGGGK